MSMPLRQTIRLGAYLMKQKVQRKEKFPLLVELEPLFACNLKCAGCGKIEQPHDVLKKRMPVEQAVAAVEESGAPMVSIAGGEPLMHKQIDEIVRQLLDRNKIVFLCTNAVLLPKHIDKFTPHRNFAWMVHIDGLRERHDESVRKVGVFDQAVAAIRDAKARGFKVMTNTTFFDTDTPADVIELLDYLNDDLGVDNMQISPGYAYERAPDQEHWLGTEQTRALFKAAFSEGRRKKWRLNHSPLFLDFLEGERDFECTPWGIPSYSLLGWQRPCYLLDDGYALTYKELIETTDWNAYGRGKDPRCDNCMAHCGYEPTAVLATMGSLRESIRAAGVTRGRSGRQRHGPHGVGVPPLQGLDHPVRPGRRERGRHRVGEDLLVAGGHAVEDGGGDVRRGRLGDVPVADHVGVDRPRQRDVHGDAPPGQQGPQRLGHRHRRGLGQRVGRGDRHRGERGQGQHVDDRAATGLERRQQRPGDPVGADQVDRQVRLDDVEVTEVVEQ